MSAFGSLCLPMAIGASTITTTSLRPRFCVPLSSSASPPTSLLFLRPPNPIFRPKRCSPISMSLAADSSSSSSPLVGRYIFILPYFPPLISPFPVRFGALLLEPRFPNLQSFFPLNIMTSLDCCLSLSWSYNLCVVLFAFSVNGLMGISCSP